MANLSRPNSASPRPSSVSSTQSNSSNISNKGGGGGRYRNDICVGEELKIAVDIALERFRMNEEQKGLYWIREVKKPFFIIPSQNYSEFIILLVAKLSNDIFS